MLRISGAFMKKSVLAITFTLLASANSFAHDSLWKMCEGTAVIFNRSEPILVNLFEHRNGAASRQTDLVLIYGGNLLSGSFDSTENEFGKIMLTQDKSTFVGKASVDYQKNTLELSGVLKLEDKTNLESILNCRTIRD
jgi:hypothetical protein